MLFKLRLLVYRLLKPFQWPISRFFAIPRPTVFVGPDSALRLCASIGQFGFQRVMIITDAVLVNLQVVEPIRAALVAQGIDVAIHDAITPDPTFPVLEAGHAAVRAHASEAILAVGGGSVIDAAKIIDAMVVTGKSPRKLIGMLKVTKPMLPLFAIPTTAGTGSEVTVAAVVTDPVRHEKSAVIDPKLVPMAAALDPMLMRGMPKPITAATGMDALTHAIEAYVNRWPHPETALHCRGAVRMIFEHLPRAYANGDRYRGARRHGAGSVPCGARVHQGIRRLRARVLTQDRWHVRRAARHGQCHHAALCARFPEGCAARTPASCGTCGGDRGGHVRPIRWTCWHSASWIACASSIVMIGIPETISSLRAGDVPAIARAAMIEAHRDYPVPKNMTLAEAEATLRRLQPSAS